MRALALGFQVVPDWEPERLAGLGVEAGSCDSWSITGAPAETFMRVYQMDCPRAAERFTTMMPERPKQSSGDGNNSAATIAETVQHFITAMDAVKLDQRAVDELQPLISDLMNALVQLPDTPNDFGPNHRVNKWLVKLNAMRAADTIDEDDGRQLYLDLDSAYSEFTRFLRAV